MAQGSGLSLIHISEPTRLGMISYAVFCFRALLLSIRLQRQMCIRDRCRWNPPGSSRISSRTTAPLLRWNGARVRSVSYTHLRAHETRHDLVCRLLLPSFTPLYSSAASDVYKRQVQMEPARILTHFESDYGAAPKVEWRKGQ